MDVPVARRLERPTWLNARTVGGLLLFGAAFVGGQRALGDARVTSAVWVATHDLSPDSPLADGDLETREVRMPDEVLSTYVPGAQTLDGAVMTRPVRAGELIARDWVADSSGSTPARSMTLSVEPDHALGGALRPGDRIDVFATFDGDDLRARTVLLLRSVEVLEIVRADSLVLEEDAVTGLTVSVAPGEAARVAFALRTAQLDIARVHGASGTEPSATVSGEDFE